MCDPISIAIMAASALGSSYFQGKAEDKVEESRAQALRANNANLEKFRREAVTSYDQSLQKVAPQQAAEDTEAAVADREEAYAPNISPSELLPGQGDASGAVKTAVVQNLNQGAQRAGDNAKRRAALDAYGDVQLGQNIEMNRNATEINAQGRNAAGQQAVLPYQLAAADHAGDKYAGMADMVGALGTIAGAGYGYYSGLPSTRMGKIAAGTGFKGSAPKFGPLTQTQMTDVADLSSYLNTVGAF